MYSISFNLFSTILLPIILISIQGKTAQLNVSISPLLSSINIFVGEIKIEILPCCFNHLMMICGSSACVAVELDWEAGQCIDTV